MGFCAACSAASSSVGDCEVCGADPRLKSPRGELYRLERCLGRGPGRTTYRAIRQGDAREVVIKESRLPRRADPKVRELVEREAAVLAGLRHPQIPQLLEHWIPEGAEVSWLVLEYVEGTDLQQWLSLCPFDEREVLGILRELCGVLGHLHGLSPPVLHRDLKPANVIRRPDGRLMLVDFGAARAGPAGATTVVGTAGYMAPEQLAGDATVLSDLYGLGALGVALLTAREMSGLVGDGLRLQWREHAHVTDGTRALLDELVSPDPQARPASIEVVRERLAKLPSPSRRPPAGTVLILMAAASWTLALILTASAGWVTALAAAAQLVR
jgi:serine/threonine protein kinase